MDKIASKLLQATNDPNKYETTLTITGAGGFGKTTTVISLCYHHAIREQFTDGFLFIELGPQATDPSIKLRAIYNLLTDIQCDINVVEQKINQTTSDSYRNLLVIIDDVWHVEDAKPLVRAFSNCKIVLTTRMNNIEQYIPSKESVSIGSMNQNEAISLLTKGVIDSRELLQQHRRLLDELAQDFHFWPLLLSLVRGQLFHYVSKWKLSFLEAIQNIKHKCLQGITAFDKIKSRSREFAVEVCIEITLNLLTKPLSDHIKILILYTGIGTSLQRTVLHLLWNVSEREAQNIVDDLWGYGLIQFNDSTISFNSTQQSCVEVHSVISQYIIESMEYREAINLAPTLHASVMDSVNMGLELAFIQSCGLGDLSALTDRDYLKFKLCILENLWLPLNLKKLNSFIVYDPYFIIWGIEVVITHLFVETQNQTSPQINNLLELIGEKIHDLITDCKQILRDAHKLCRKLNQGVQKNLFKKDYDKVIQSVQDYINSYPLGTVTKKIITMVKKAIPYCHEVSQLCEIFWSYTPEYHRMTTITFPGIKFYMNLHKEGHIILLSGSDDDIKKTCDFYKTSKFIDAVELIRESGKSLMFSSHS